MAQISDLRDMQIRRAGEADAAAVRELTRSAYAKWVPLIGREPMPMTADYERAVRGVWSICCASTPYRWRSSRPSIRPTIC